MTLERLRTLLPAVWVGLLLTVALIATPAPFATLTPGEAARVVARVLAHEAYASLALGVVVLLLERRRTRDALALAEAAGGPGPSQFGPGVALALGALFCTVLGYFAVQPLLPAARTGQGAFTFAQLHAASVACFVVKIGLVAALAWRGQRRAAVTPASS